MARRASVRYWPSRGAYCCWINGKQTVLAEGPDDMFQGGPTWKAAHKKFYEMKILGNADAAKDDNHVSVVCELYLRHIAKRRKTRTYQIRKQYLQAFVDSLGETSIRSLTRHMVDAWTDSMQDWRKHPATGHQTRWTTGSVRNAIASIQAAINWAAQSGLITKNPLGAMPSPRARSRGREALIGRNPEERAENHKRILAAATSYFRPFIVCLEATGCRPGELIHATAADFDEAMGAIIYHAEDNRREYEHSHKTAGKGKDRVILFTGGALTIIKSLVEKYRSGPLFRTRGCRRGWHLHEVMRRFRLIRGKTKIPGLTAYSYRHTFATAWLEQGKSIEVLAEILGNTPEVIRKHYSHLLVNHASLRRQLEAFRAADVSA